MTQSDAGFGPLLHDYRVRAGLSQNGLARRAGVDAEMVHRSVRDELERRFAGDGSSYGSEELTRDLRVCPGQRHEAEHFQLAPAQRLGERSRAR